MNGMVPDNDIVGHFRIIRGHLTSENWRQVWNYLNITVHSFEELGMATDSTDRLVWQTCQRRDVVLITGNRNDDGPDSLEATIRDSNTPQSLPVLTLANPNRLRNDSGYVEKVVERLLEYLLEIDKYHGTGRLYLP